MQLPLLGFSPPLRESISRGKSITSYILLTSFLFKLQQLLVTINHPDTTQPISGEARPDRLHLALALQPLSALCSFPAKSRSKKFSAVLFQELQVINHSSSCLSSSLSLL